jgi:hypothetical protein
MVLLPLSAAAADKGQEEAVPTEKAYQAAMMAAATPGEPHRLLARMAGVWDVTTRIWMVPGQEPTTSTGTLHSQVILGDRYVRGTMEAEFMGMPYEGVGLTGYDNVRQQYFSTWIDNMSTGIAYMTGSLDEKGEAMVMTGTWVDPLTRIEHSVRTESRFETDDKVVWSYYMPSPDGGEFKSMEMVYVRKE